MTDIFAKSKISLRNDIWRERQNSGRVPGGMTGAQAKARTKVVVDNNKWARRQAAGAVPGKPKTSSAPKKPAVQKNTKSSKTSSASKTTTSSKSSSKSKKTKNKNYYKSGKFNNVQWVANVTNDESKTIPTLVFSKNFLATAMQLKAVKSKINKDLNNVTKQIKKIKKDSKTGEVLKSTLTNQLNVYETTRKDFLKDVKDLYNGAINTYNDWMQSVYEELSKQAITNQGTTQRVDGGNISADDDNGIDA